ncbi:MAG: methenyltetrahydromethanopterin cyclohydrolase [Halobacteriaceae archaeon]
MEPLNRTAVELVDEALDFAGELAIGAHELENGATVLDFGVEHRGGVEAGLLLAEIAAAGLASVQTRLGRVDGHPLTHVELVTDHPDLALLGSMRGGWELAVDGYEALAGGPARAIVAEEAVFDALGYAEHAEFGVLVLESDRLPTAAVADTVAERTGLDAQDVFLAVCPAASVAGSVLAAARAAEVTCGRLHDLGVDPGELVSTAASAPVPPVAETESAALARGTDAVAYGGEVQMTLGTGAADADLADLASTASGTYGRPFADVFAAVDWDYAAVEASAFGPAAVTADVLGGPTHALGERDDAVLAESFAI